MAVYYKFKSERNYDSIPVDVPFISVGTLKQKIFKSKLGKGTDLDLLVTNAQTNEDYNDEATLIPKNTSVLIRRLPGLSRLPIVIELEQKAENRVVETEPEEISLPAEDTSAMKYPEDSDWDEFSNDSYTIPSGLPVQTSNLIPDATPTNKADEDSKIKALNDALALDWQRPGSEFGTGRGFGRGKGGRMGGGRGFGLEWKTPPQGYVCRRCKVPGHFIQHCPTNGDPNYDIKRVKQPTGIPRSMLMVNPHGSSALPNNTVAVLKPNEAAFEKEIEGLPSTRSVRDLPPELHCPLCSDVMKDAVLTSKCCFKSFCDKCIRDYIMSKSMCNCGATNILADDLLPNKTLRDTINRILESGNSSSENAGSTFQIQVVESAHCPQPKIPSPTSSAASKGEPKVSTANEGATNIQETADDRKAVSAPQQTSEKVMAAIAADVSETTHESMSVKEPASQGSAQLVERAVKQNLVPNEADMEFTRCPQPKIPFPSSSAASKGEPKVSPANEGTTNIQETADDRKAVSAAQQTSEQVTAARAADVSEATHESMSVKEPALQGSAQLVEEAVQQKLVPNAAGKKRRKKKVLLPVNDLQWKTSEELGAENYMMPMGPTPGYHSYWNGMQPGMEGFMAPYADPVQMMGYGLGPLGMPFVSVLPQDPFGMQGYPLPVVPPHSHRDIAEFSVGMNAPPSIMSRAEFEARKADMRRKRENERRIERDFPKDREFGREVSSGGDVSSMKSKAKPIPPSSITDYYQRHRSERLSADRSPREVEPWRPAKRKSDHDGDGDYDEERHRRRRSESTSRISAEAAERKLKVGVFSSISFPEGKGEVTKKRKVFGSEAAATAGASVADYESSDDERHFKRRRSRYQPSPSPEGRRHSRERKHRHR